MTSSTEAANIPSNDAPESNENTAIKEPRLWRDDGWTAKVVKNQDDEGWAVEMYIDGQAEPALVAGFCYGPADTLPVVAAKHLPGNGSPPLSDHDRC